MRKHLAGWVITAMAATLLALVNPATASAKSVSANAPYPGTVATRMQVVGLGPFRRRAKVFVKITSNSGVPKGRLRFTFVRKKTGNTRVWTRPVRGTKHRYRGFTRMNRGRWTVLVTYVPKAGSKWKATSGRANLRVKPRR